MSKPDLTLETPDSLGYIPEVRLIGTNWQHYGNGHAYVIVGFTWNGETDRWMLRHYRFGTPGVEYCRTPENFFGLIDETRTRYKPHPR